jgi:hypothetical protein
MMVLLGAASLFGCASKPPTIAHTHIGHAITGWHDTPGQNGLLVTAEREADATLRFARAANLDSPTLSDMKDNIRSGMHTIDPSHGGGSGGLGYGVRKATSSAIDHLLFARDSDDVSANIRNSVEPIAQKAEEIVQRCDLMLVVGDEVLDSSNIDEAGLFAREFVDLAELNAFGAAGDKPEDYGLKQFRADIEQMIGRESPPYTTIGSRYLLGLIRLPSGKWTFVQPRSFDDYGGGGGGGY